MKKILALVLALVLVTVTSVTALADGDGWLSDPTGSGNSSSKSVTIALNASSATLPDEYHVKITWEKTDGSYALETGAIKWNYDELKYTIDSAKFNKTAPSLSATVVNASTPGNNISASLALNDGGNNWDDYVASCTVGTTDVLRDEYTTVVPAVENASAAGQGTNGLANGESNAKTINVSIGINEGNIETKLLELARSTSENKSLALMNTFILTISPDN